MSEKEKRIEVIKSMTLANEFLKILRSYKLEIEKENPMPDEVVETLAQTHLNHVMEKFGLDPEHLIWGLVQILEMFLSLTDTKAEDLSGALDRFIEFAREQEGIQND